MSMPTDIDIVDLGIGFPHTLDRTRRRRRTTSSAPTSRTPRASARWSSRCSTCSRACPTSCPEGTDVVEWVVEKMDDVQHPHRPTSDSRSTASRPGAATPIGSSSECRSIRTTASVRSATSRRRRPSTTSSRRWCSRRAACRRSRSTTGRCTRCTRSASELDIPICVNGGIVGPRMPSWPQQVSRFDEVCYDFPDLTIVMMHGGEPWTTSRSSSC